MKINFLDSGLDSLKKGFHSLSEYERLTFSYDVDDLEEVRFYHLKDAILFIQHGIEILIKKIIQNHSEYLLFSRIDKHVKDALKQKNNKKLNSVFETELKYKIHTVTFNESIERLKIIPGIQVPLEFEKRLKELELYRNIIMHSEPFLNEKEINDTLDGLSDELDMFFHENIGEAYKMVSGYDDLMTNIERFKTLLREKGHDLKIKSVETIIKALKKARISMGRNEVKRITDLNKCSKFLEEMLCSKLTFGMDLYNGFCSGLVNKFNRKGASLFELYAADNEVFFQFMVKSIILYIPAIHDDKSPIIFIESDEIEFNSNDCDGQKLTGSRGVESLKYLKMIEDGSFVYQEDEIYTIFENDDLNSTDYEHYIKFFTKGLFCFLNIQGLEYNHGFRRFVWEGKTFDGKQFEVSLRNALTK